MLTKNILLLDMNATGDDPDIDRILEISLIPIEVNELEVKKHGKVNFYPLNHYEKIVKLMDNDTFRNFHKTNLINDLINPDNKENTFHSENPRNPINKILNNIFKYQEITLCGFNIDLQRRFLCKYIKNIDKYISNNSIDLYSYIFINNIYDKHQDYKYYFNYRTTETIEYIYNIFYEFNQNISKINGLKTNPLKSFINDKC